MKQTLQLKLTQHLTLTPQLQQSIRLLQLSTLELNAEVDRMLQENPLLEREDGDDDVPPPEYPLAGTAPIAKCEASVSILEQPVIVLQDVSHVVIRDLDIETTRGCDAGE